MAISKTAKVFWTAIGGGALAVTGTILICTGVGSGFGVPIITHALAVIGGVVGGGMISGIGVLAAGSATAAALAAAIANKVIKDPELVKLAEKLIQANEIYSAAKNVTDQQKKEIAKLNAEIGKLLRANTKNSEAVAELRERLAVLIDQLKRSAA